MRRLRYLSLTLMSLMATVSCAEPARNPPVQGPAAALQQDEAWFIARLKGPRERSEGHLLDARLQYVLETVTRPQSVPQAKAAARAFHSTQAGRDTTRGALERYWASHTAPTEGVSTTDETLKTRDGEIPVRIFTPDSLKGQTGVPVLVYYHGGGFMFGSLDGFDPAIRAIAKAANVIVVAPGYRLAPEHPYPAAHNDAEDAWLWTQANAARFGGDPARIGVGGDSAGATLALSVALRQIRKPAEVPSGLLLYYAGVDREGHYPSQDEFASGYGLDADNLGYLAGLVYPEGVATTREDTSPLQADLCGLPRAVIATAGFDPLRDSNRAFAAKLEATGVRVETRHYPGLIHGFLQTSAYVPDAKTATDETARLFGAQLREPHTKPGCTS